MGIQERTEVEESTSADLRAELHCLEEVVERLSKAFSLSQAPTPQPITAKQLRRLIKARRMREEILGIDLFADAAWDILLEAYLSQLTETKISVTGLCHAAAVPPTTALRWIQKLEEDGWLSRRADPLDARRSWIALSEGGANRLSNYFGSVDGVLPL